MEMKGVKEYESQISFHDFIICSMCLYDLVFSIISNLSCKYEKGVYINGV